MSFTEEKNDGAVYAGQPKDKLAKFEIIKPTFADYTICWYDYRNFLCVANNASELKDDALAYGWVSFERLIGDYTSIKDLTKKINLLLGKVVKIKELASEKRLNNSDKISDEKIIYLIKHYANEIISNVAKD